MMHLVPSAEDCAKHDKSPTTDIFGRSRFAEERGNRGGVGSFFSMSRTLYVGYGAASEQLGARLQEVMSRVFGEWGPLEDVYVVRSKSIAFVRYVFRASAEFAKEALHNQSLQPAWWPQPRGAAGAAPEVLNIRWAYDDPNPTAIRRNKRENEEAFADSAAREEARLPPAQRAALAQQRALEAATAGASAGGAAVAYPDTDAQYGAGAQSAAYAAWAQQALAAGYTAEEVAAYYAACSAASAAGSPAPAAAPPQPAVVQAADCYEYDADDPYYQLGDDDDAPQAAAADAAAGSAGAAAAEAPAAAPAAPQPGPAAPPLPRAAPAAAAPPAPGNGGAAAAPLALLATYGSDSEADSGGEA